MINNHRTAGKGFVMIARFLLLASVASASFILPAAHAQDTAPQEADAAIVGGAIVVASGLVIWFREKQLDKVKRLAPHH